MKLFITSKNTGPSWHSDPVHFLGIHATLDEAIALVDNFVRYEKEWQPASYMPTCVPYVFSPKMVKYYMADGWWYSIVEVEISEPKDKAVADNGWFPHKCEQPGCDITVEFDDEPYCFTHSPDEGSSVAGYSAMKKADTPESWGV